MSVAMPMDPPPGAVQRPLFEHEDFVVWKNPKGRNGTLAILTAGRVIFSHPGDPVAIEASIEDFRHNGALPPRSREILAHSIVRIRFNKRETDVAVYYAKDESSSEIHYHDFGNPTARDSFIAAFRDEFGNRFDDRTREHTPLSAAIRPLAMAGLVGALTWTLYQVSSELAMVDALGPRGVLLAGGLSFALTLGSLIRRVAHPPILRTLTQKA